MVIETYQEKYKAAIAQLILDIQQNEFNVPVTISDQPDLLDIEDFYFRKDGNFWVAVENERVIGTIALI
ncbi:MAG: GNAT family N-acetyltransferase, partial [Chitinophagaceae bacterium]